MPPIETSTIFLLILWARASDTASGSVALWHDLGARAMGLGNLREIGSGNIGATNVLRTGSKKAAAADAAARWRQRRGRGIAGAAG